MDKWDWPGVSAKGGETEVISPACGCFVSQSGDVAGGTEVGENVEVPKTAESVD